MHTEVTKPLVRGSHAYRALFLHRIRTHSDTVADNQFNLYLSGFKLHTVTARGFPAPVVPATGIPAPAAAAAADVEPKPVRS